MTASRWFADARPDGGGLLIPGRPRGRGGDLLLVPGGVRVSAGEEVIELPWEATPTGSRLPSADEDHWLLGPMTVTRSGPVGAAVYGWGAYAEPVHRIASGLKHPVWVFPFGIGHHRAALAPARLPDPALDRDLAMLVALCDLVRRRPAWRAGLGEPARVEGLVRDALASRHRAMAPEWGIARRTVDTVGAMTVLGYTHPLAGRPVPGDPMPDEEHAVTAVLTRLRANPHALEPDEDSVRRLVRSRYLDVEPWPFAALVPDRTPGAR